MADKPHVTRRFTLVVSLLAALATPAGADFFASAESTPIAEAHRSEIAKLIIRLQASQIAIFRIRDQLQQSEASAKELQTQLEKEIDAARKDAKLDPACMPTADLTWSCEKR